MVREYSLHDLESPSDNTVISRVFTPIYFDDNDARKEKRKQWISMLETPKEPKPSFGICSILSGSSERYILKHLVPVGYPKTISPGYTRHASYCFVGSVAGSTAMILSTSSLLVAVGVGTHTAAPMAASLNWILKDGVGQIGGMLFASKISSRSAINIDADPKRWRMFSAVSLDIATLVEILTLLSPENFLLIASAANILKNIGFLTASASRARIHQSIALKNNLGDVTAKAGSQSLIASLMGTGFGVILSPLIGGDCTYIISGFIVMSTIHQLCIYQSLRSVTLNHLNRHRVDRLFTILFEKHVSEDTNDFGKFDDRGMFIPSPDTVSTYERFFPFVYPDESHKWLQIGCSIVDIYPNGVSDFEILINHCLRNEKYIINYDIHTYKGGKSTIKKMNYLKSVKVSFHKKATNTDILRALFHAYMIRSICECSKSLANSHTHQGRENIIMQSYKLMDEHFDSFFQELSLKGWDTETEIAVEVNSGKRFCVERF